MVSRPFTSSVSSAGPDNGLSERGFEELAAAAFQHQKTAAQVIADTIRRSILRGYFSPGQPLPQEELARQFKVSRAPVRDALRQLESEGLVVVHSKVSEVVRLSREDGLEIFMLRETLESRALQLAIPNMSDADLRAAEKLLDYIDQEPDLAHMAELNWEFHEVLYRPSGMQRLLAISRGLNNIATPYHHLGYIEYNGKSKSQEGHRMILEACKAKDQKMAVAALIDHLSFSESILLELL